LIPEALPPLRAVIDAHKLATRKALGQHFLLDMNITRAIVARAALTPQTHVIEIGPGPGGLTRALLESPIASCTAIERDKRCIEALAPLVKAAGGRLTLIEEDALKTSPQTLVPAPRAIVANLPYNIGTQLLLQWLPHAAMFESMTLMFQKEVADRLLAAPHSKDYGRLTLAAQFFCNMQRVMKLRAAAFWPPPKIDSAMLRFTPRADRPSDVDFETFEALTKAAFGQRRKMLRAALKSFGGEALLERAQIPASRRAEDLSLKDFETLTRLFANP